MVAEDIDVESVLITYLNWPKEIAHHSIDSKSLIK